MTADFRLAAPAVSAWLAGLVLIALPRLAAQYAAGLLGLAAVALLAVILIRRARRPGADASTGMASRVQTRRETVGITLALAAASAALIGAVVSGSGEARFPADVRTAAENRSLVTATLTVWSSPVVEPAFGASARRPAVTAQNPASSATGERLRFRAVLSALDGGFDRGAHASRLSVPVVAFTAMPAGGALPHIGAEIRVEGVLVATDAGDAAAALFFGRSPPVAVTAPPQWLSWANELRDGFSAIAAGLPGAGGEMLPGLAIGDTAAVSGELDAAMKASSLSHLTAVSGANCAVVIAGIMLLGRQLGLRRRWRILLALGALSGFVVLVTPEPSVLRSAVMASVVLMVGGLGRPSRGVPTLCLVVIGLLVADPWLARNYGFALSVLATAGLLLLAAPLTRLLARWMPVALAAVIAIPLAAQLACQPVLVLLNPTLALYGVPANLVAAPAAPIATVIGLLACLLGPWLPAVAGVVAQVAWLPSAWIAAVAQTVASLPGNRLPWLDGVAGVVLIAAVTALALALLLGRRTRGAAWWPVAAAAVLLIVTGGYLGSLLGTQIGRTAGFPADWQIAACDIGQGDAVLVRDGTHVALIDVGPEPAALAACLSELGIDRIELLVLSHYDLDHIGGVEAVLGRVDHALVGAPENDDDIWLHERLLAGGATVTESSWGDIGSLGRLRWEVLWPDGRDGTQPVGNAGSITVSFDGLGIRSIFLGDLGEEAQDAMVAVAQPGTVDVVKVAHHGSADQSAELYRRLHATVGLISVGADNGYGHPTKRLLDLLAASGTTAMRTDLQGLTVVAPATQGDGALTVWTERRARPEGLSAAPTRLE